MSTQEEVVKELKSLKSEFNRMRKIEGRADDESLSFWCSQKLATAIAAIASNDIPEAKSVLNKLKEDFDHRAKFFQETKDHLEQFGSSLRLKDDRDHVTNTLKLFQNYSSKVANAIAQL